MKHINMLSFCQFDTVSGLILHGFASLTLEIVLATVCAESTMLWPVPPVAAGVAAAGMVATTVVALLQGGGGSVEKKQGPKFK